jgi:hypothetical protein
MYRTLFELAGPAIAAWLMLVFFPRWRVTRRVGESAAFPAYLCVLYAVGLILVLRESGAGFMRDFGSVEGVLGLLRTEPIALIAWIHILAFDQVVGLLIYRDNMRHRFVPLPVQSVILALTLMLGPIGFLAYWALRMTRRSAGLAAWGERDATQWVEPPVGRRFVDVTSATTVAGVVRDLIGRSPLLVKVAIGGFAMAGVLAVVAAVNGGWHLAPEGRLLEAVKFNVAIGIYLLTIAAVLPLAGFTDTRHRRYVLVLGSLVAFGILVETMQSLRGLDPRFSRVAGAPDRILGGVFFFSALGIFWYFLDLFSTFFRRDALPDHPLLRDALRYAAFSAVMAFGVGIVISFVGSRFIVGPGNLMPVHAAGFHAIQAVPLVALLLGWSGTDSTAARRVLSLAASGWLALTAGLLIQALRGLAPTEAGIGVAIAAAGGLAWLAALGSTIRMRPTAAGRSAGG